MSHRPTTDAFLFGDAVTLTVAGSDLGSVPGNILLELSGEVRMDFVLDVGQQEITVDLPVGSNSGEV